VHLERDGPFRPEFCLRVGKVITVPDGLHASVLLSRAHKKGRPAQQAKLQTQEPPSRRRDVAEGQSAGACRRAGLSDDHRHQCSPAALTTVSGEPVRGLRSARHPVFRSHCNADLHLDHPGRGLTEDLGRSPLAGALVPWPSQGRRCCWRTLRAIWLYYDSPRTRRRTWTGFVAPAQRPIGCVPGELTYLARRLKQIFLSKLNDDRRSQRPHPSAIGDQHRRCGSARNGPYIEEVTREEQTRWPGRQACRKLGRCPGRADGRDCRELWPGRRRATSGRAWPPIK